jgi:hypothetical protein
MQTPKIKKKVLKRDEHVDNIEIDFEEMWFGDGDWIHPAPGKDE